MELSKTIILITGILLTGLAAGLCFTWTNSITPGIGRLNDLEFLQSFQSMNRVIINPIFLIVFFGPIILLFLNSYLFRHANTVTFWTFLTAAMLFFLGVGLVTIFKNVPLNEILDKTILETATKTELIELRKKFEDPWNKWHLIRTMSSIISFTLLLIGMLFTK